MDEEISKNASLTPKLSVEQSGVMRKLSAYVFYPVHQRLNQCLF